MGVWILRRNHKISSRYWHCFLFWETRRWNLIYFKNSLWGPFHNDRTANFCFFLESTRWLKRSENLPLTKLLWVPGAPVNNPAWSFQTALHPVARSIRPEVLWTDTYQASLSYSEVKGAILGTFLAAQLLRLSLQYRECGFRPWLGN